MTPLVALGVAVVGVVLVFLLFVAALLIVLSRGPKSVSRQREIPNNVATIGRNVRRRIAERAR